jgi:hypothetical protein
MKVFIKWRFVYMELLLGHEKIITKWGDIKSGFYWTFEIKGGSGGSGIE